MREIRELVHEIKDELKDSNKYYIKALLSTTAESKETYKTLAVQEIEHAMKLHNLVLADIKKTKESGVVVPDAMLKLWDYEHKEIITDVDDLKSKISKL